MPRRPARPAEQPRAWPGARPAAAVPLRCAPSCATSLRLRSQERLPFSPIRRDRVEELIALDDGELVEVLGEFTRLRVPEPHAIARREAPRGAARDRRLHLT